MDATAEKKIKWTSVESNPEVLTALAHALGADKDWGFVDIYGFDDDLLSMVPTPVQAVVLLHPGGGEGKQQTSLDSSSDVYKKTFFLEQISELGNACGTIAVIHSVSNAHTPVWKSGDPTVLQRFIKSVESLKPSERGAQLAQNKEINEIHCESSKSGQTQMKTKKVDAGDGKEEEEETDVNYHFICFVNVDGHLLELDGIQRHESGMEIAPRDHGAGHDPSKLLQDAAKIITEEWIKKHPNTLTFSAMALTKIS